MLNRTVVAAIAPLAILLVAFGNSLPLQAEPMADPIADVVNARLMQNFADGKFYPGRILSRAEIATILVKAFNLNQLQTGKSDRRFVDVPNNHWAYKAIQIAVNTETMTGYEKERFFPNQRVNRAEGFAIFANAYGIFQFPEDTVKEILAKVPDHQDLPVWARKAWATALNENFVNLNAEGKINALMPLTRADMAYALSRFLEKERGRNPSSTQPSVPTK